MTIITLRTVWPQVRANNPIDTLKLFLIDFLFWKTNVNFEIKVVARVNFGAKPLRILKTTLGQAHWSQMRNILFLPI